MPRQTYKVSFSGVDMKKLSVQQYIAGGCVLFLISPAFAITYDATTQFDVNSNPATIGGWSYGYSSSLGGPFTLLVAKPNSPTFFDWAYSQSNFYPDIEKNISGSDYTNTFGGGGFVPKDAISLGPGQGATVGLIPIVRWTAPNSGDFSVNSSFTGVWNQPNSIGGVHILLNGISVFDGSIDHRSTASYSGLLAVSMGDKIDFALQEAAPNTWARAILTATLAPVPEPATAAYLLFGILTVGLGFKTVAIRQARRGDA